MTRSILLLGEIHGFFRRTFSSVMQAIGHVATRYKTKADQGKGPSLPLSLALYIVS